MRNRPLILGVTGSIASGKTSVATAFEKYGAALVSADQLARDIVQPGSIVLSQLVERFGKKILTDVGALDRERLAQIVFTDEQARDDLNRMTHPAIGRLAFERLQEHVDAGGPLVVYEAPLLFEAGAEQRVDRVLVVKIDPDIQLQRLMVRDGLNEAEARQRVNAQISQEEKLARADFMIDNSGSPEETLRQVGMLWQILTAEEE